MTKQQIHAVIFLILILSATVLLCACGNVNREGSEYGKQLDGICSYLEEVQEGYINAGDSASDWTVIVFAKAGREFDYDAYLKGMDDYVTRCFATEENLNRIRATELQRIALAVTAAGGDPRSVGKDQDGNAIDLIAEGTYGWSQEDALSEQGSNALIYALLVLDSGNYDVPEGSRYTRESILDELLQYQDNSGAFALSPSAGPDADITAMAVQALAPYVTESRRAAEAVDMAIAYLSAQQQDSSLYLSNGGYSSETISQVILALCAIDRDPAEDEDFIKAGGSLIDGLMQFRMDDGSFAHEIPEDKKASGDNLMSSQQAGLAFEALIDVQKKNAETGEEE